MLSYVKHVGWDLVIGLVFGLAGIAIGRFLITVGQGGVINFVPAPWIGGIILCGGLLIPLAALYDIVAEAHRRLPTRAEKHALEVALALAAVVAAYLFIANDGPSWAGEMSAQFSQAMRSR